MECVQNLPLVSVPVITYNSSKTVIETLNSIYAQTYPNLELIVSDDCSSDNTVEIVREWIDKYKERFVRTELIIVERNTGISGSCNRAEAVCQGEWIKGIAGDDLLVEDCIESCAQYVLEHENVVVLFGRQDAFGADEERCSQINAVFDYETLQAPAEKQLHKLIFENNYIPATTLFYHKERMRATGVRNDERIPLLEDWPKWINLLRVGVQFHFIDKVLVKYRIGGISTQKQRMSPAVYRSNRLMRFLYQYPEWYRENIEEAVSRIVDEEMSLYEKLFELEGKGLECIIDERDYYRDRSFLLTAQLCQREKSKAYRLGKFLLSPLSALRKLLKF